MLTTKDIARVAFAAEQAAQPGNYRKWDDLSDPEQAHMVFEVVQILAGMKKDGTPVFRAICQELHTIGERIHKEVLGEKIVMGRLIVDVPEPEESELERVARLEGGG